MGKSSIGSHFSCIGNSYESTKRANRKGWRVMRENKQDLRALDDEGLGETTGGIPFGLRAPIVTMGL